MAPVKFLAAAFGPIVRTRVDWPQDVRDQLDPVLPDPVDYGREYFHLQCVIAVLVGLALIAVAAYLFGLWMRRRRGQAEHLQQ